MQSYPQIIAVIRDYVEHNKLGEKDSVLLYEVLVHGVRKQRRIYGMWLEMLRLMDYHDSLLIADRDFHVNRYCQKYQYRRSFSFFNLPKNVPFEVACYFRSYKMQKQQNF